MTALLVASLLDGAPMTREGRELGISRKTGVDGLNRQGAWARGPDDRSL
jgi:hypothetical protein